MKKVFGIATLAALILTGCTATKSATPKLPPSPTYITPSNFTSTAPTETASPSGLSEAIRTEYLRKFEQQETPETTKHDELLAEGNEQVAVLIDSEKATDTEDPAIVPSHRNQSALFDHYRDGGEFCISDTRPDPADESKANTESK